MKGSWYNKNLLKVKDITAQIKEVVNKLKEFKTIKDIYVWGSYAQHIKEPNYRVKDVDILITTSVHSEDLISIDNKIIKENKSNEELENDGFDPIAINLSKKIASIKYPLLDFWAISGDKRLLHWGAIFADKQDSDQLKIEAERFAERQTGTKINKFNQTSEIKRRNWYETYKRYYLTQFSDMPSGWHQSDEKDIDSILNKVINIKGD